jgi:hypothetical protein
MLRQEAASSMSKSSRSSEKSPAEDDASSSEDRYTSCGVTCPVSTIAGRGIAVFFMFMPSSSLDVRSALLGGRAGATSGIELSGSYMAQKGVWSSYDMSVVGQPRSVLSCDASAFASTVVVVEECPVSLREHSSKDMMSVMCWRLGQEPLRNVLPRSVCARGEGCGRDSQREYGCLDLPV